MYDKTYTKRLFQQFSDHIKYADMFLEPAISIEFNNVDSNNLAGFEERTRVLYMIHLT